MVLNLQRDMQLRTMLSILLAVTGDIKMLTFDTPMAYRRNFPQQVRVGQDIFQVTHRGGVPRTHRSTGIRIYNETNREHWERVIQKGLPPIQKKSVLIRNEQSNHSVKRFEQFTEHILESMTITLKPHWAEKIRHSSL